MEMPTDSDHGSPKRVRLDPTATNADPITKNALASAQQHIQAHVTSLHQQTATILSRCARQHLSLQHKHQNKLDQLQKMEGTDSFFPRSASIKFALSGTKKAMQEPEFVQLQDETSALVETFKQNLKTKIIAATKIEI